MKIITPTTNYVLAMALGFQKMPSNVGKIRLIEYNKVEDGDFSDEICSGIWDMTIACLLDYNLDRETIKASFYEINMDVFGQNWSDGEGYKNYFEIGDLVRQSFANKWRVMYPSFALNDLTIVSILDIQHNTSNLWDDSLYFGAEIDLPIRQEIINHASNK